jgi:transcriptional regulator with XRE-family HTH domain
VTDRRKVLLVIPPARPEVPGARWHLDRALVDRTRVLRGLTRAELARRAQVDPATLSDMLRGHRRPTFGSVQAVCVVLGLDLGDVIVFVDDQEERSVA